MQWIHHCHQCQMQCCNWRFDIALRTISNSSWISIIHRKQHLHRCNFILGSKNKSQRGDQASTGGGVESSWNVMAHSDTQEGKWRGHWWMEWVASTHHTISELGVSSITTGDAHTSAASSQLNWRPCLFTWIHPFRQKTKYGFCTCATTFQTQSTTAMFLTAKPCCPDKAACTSPMPQWTNHALFCHF